MLTRSKARYTGQVPIVFQMTKQRMTKTKETKETKKTKKEVVVRSKIITRSQTRMEEVNKAAARVADVLFPLYQAFAEAGTVEERNVVCIAIIDFILRSPRDIPFLIRFYPPFAATLRSKCREFAADRLASVLLRELSLQALRIF